MALAKTHDGKLKGPIPGDPNKNPKGPKSSRVENKEIGKPLPAKRPTILAIDAFSEVLHRRDGKDKTIKILQYTGKLILRFQNSAQVKPLFDSMQLVPTLDPLVKQMSLFRKVIKLGEWLKPLRGFQKSTTAAHWSAIEWAEFLDGFNGIADDLELLAKIGTLNRRLEDRFALAANYLWLATIFINLKNKLSVAKENRDTIIWRVDVAKLLCDLTFCVLDILQLPYVDPLFQIITGLSSASLAYFKIWYKVRA